MNHRQNPWVLGQLCTDTGCSYPSWGRIGASPISKGGYSFEGEVTGLSTLTNLGASRGHREWLLGHTPGGRSCPQGGDPNVVHIVNRDFFIFLSLRAWNISLHQ